MRSTSPGKHRLPPFLCSRLATTTFLNQLTHLLTSPRYAIDDASADWSVAEAQVRNTLTGGGRGKSTVVSVEATGAAGQKRKLDDATPAAEAKSKKNRRSFAKKR